MIRPAVTTIILTAMIAVSGCSKRTSEQVDSNDTSYYSSRPEEEGNPKYAACLTCFIGKIGSRSNCSSTIGKPGENVPGFKVHSQKMTCGYPGEISEIEWKFIEHKNNRDIYSLKRMFPADANEYTVTSKTVTFDGNQVVVFRDEHHVVVLDSPDK
ncbi:MAG: hypothetical protein ACYSUC_08495 [Planctomycetota bacterium]|jgi:hypothetical protein